MDREAALDLSREIFAHPDFEVLISGANTSYLLPKGDVILPLIRDRTGNNTVCLSRLEDIPEDILKVSCFSPKGTDLAEEVLLPRPFRPRWPGTPGWTSPWPTRAPGSPDSAEVWGSLWRM